MYRVTTNSVVLYLTTTFDGTNREALTRRFYLAKKIETVLERTISV